MARRFTLARFLLRPIDSFKRAYKIFNNVDIVVGVKIEDTTKVEHTKPGDYVVYNNLAFPAETWRLIQPSLIKVDYNYSNGDRLWKFHKDKQIYTYVLTKDEVTAMHVAKRFEEAS